MPKDLEDLKNRLLSNLVISGPGLISSALPVQVLLPSDSSVLAVANGFVKQKDKSQSIVLARELLDALAKAKSDAASDLATLGHDPTPRSIQAYIDRFALWPRPGDVEIELPRAVQASTRAAPRELLSRLPSTRTMRPGGAMVIKCPLSAAGGRAMERAIFSICRVRLLHERALTLRPEYLRLRSCKVLPDRALFERGLNEALAGLLLAGHRLGRAEIEAAIGGCAATVSKWRLENLRWELKRCDLEMLPLGSYLNPRPTGAPKQLQIWYAIDYQLRHGLGTEMTEYAISRSLATALKIFAGKHLAPGGDIDEFAQNSIEKLRRRIGSKRLAEFEAQIEVEGSVIAFVPDPQGSPRQIAVTKRRTSARPDRAERPRSRPSGRSRRSGGRSRR